MVDKKDLLEQVGNIFFSAIKEAKTLTDNLQKMEDFIISQNKPIIRKSGETYVARFNDLDFFCLRPNELNPNNYDIKKSQFINLVDAGIFSLSDKIKITDEIAKLRPMCWSSCGMFLLWGIDKGNTAISQNHNYVVSKTRLATVDDLP